jgi:protein-S-isoprenylcysteine O-methyltransferase Ste14
VNALKTVLFTLVMPGAVAVYVPWLLLPASAKTWPPPSGPLAFIAIIPIGIGVVFYLWCATDFVRAGKGTPAPIDPPKALVVRGLYRYTRNPMYVGVVNVLLGEALLFLSPSLLIYATVVAISVHTFVVLYEEPTLSKKFGPAYDAYRAQVPRWIGCAKHQQPSRDEPR